MAGLLPLLIALTIVETSVHPGRATTLGQPSAAHFLVWIAGGCAMWWLVCETVGRLIARHATAAGPRRSTGRRLIDHWDLAAQVLILGAFATLCYGLGWSRQSSWYSLALAPWAAAQAIHWWCLALPVRMASGVPWTRSALLWHNVRFTLLPLAIALPVLDLCAWFARATRLEGWLAAHLGDSMNVIGGALLALAVVGLLPWLLVRMWGARPLEDPLLLNELATACRHAGVRVGAIMRWPVRGGRVYNAMVLGVLPRLRYVLFTDDLLRDFRSDERVAVLGHELGHARHHHLWIYLLFALATGLISWAAREPLAVALADLPMMQILSADLRMGLVALALLGIQWRLLFGYLSRACERQADVAGAELAGEGDLRHGSAVMQRALLSVARLAGIDPNAPSWRHHSIAERVRWLALVAGQPNVALRHHRRVRLVVELLAAAAGVLLALAVARQI